MKKIYLMLLLASHYAYAADDKSITSISPQQQELFNRFMTLNIIKPDLLTFQQLIHKGEDQADYEFTQIANSLYQKKNCAYQILLAIQKYIPGDIVSSIPHCDGLVIFNQENQIPPLAPELFHRLFKDYMVEKRKEFLTAWVDYIKKNPQSQYYGQDGIDQLNIDELADIPSDEEIY